MTNKEKLNILEEIMELDEGTLTPETNLSDLDEWDSVTAISLIAYMEETYGKVVQGSQIRKFKTVADVMSLFD
ncbi:MAG: acyl carrier protein [Tissierellia bacterium]|jgi:acyl carrier protein|nr:acyl carrier protein [Tissierellia bacterium]